METGYRYSVIGYSTVENDNYYTAKTINTFVYEEFNMYIIAEFNGVERGKE